jgi:type I restriction enzyme M protein
LFLKMADEQAGGGVPEDHSWRSLVRLDSVEMHAHYRPLLPALGEYGGMLGLIFRNAKNKIRDPILLLDLCLFWPRRSPQTT